MKNKALILIVTYSLLITGIGLLESCFRMDVCFNDIIFQGYTARDPYTDEIDTMREENRFEIYADRRNMVCFRSLGFISGCYATSIGYVWKNDLVDSSFTLALNRDIVLNGDTIDAGADLFKKSAFRQNTLISRDGIKYINYQIDLPERGIMPFDTGVYVVSFSCTSTDSKFFQKLRRVVFHQ